VIPDLSLLLALILGLVAIDPSGRTDAPIDVLRALGGTAAVTLVVVALTRMSADRALRELEEADREDRSASARWTGVLPLLGWMGVLYGFGWGDFVGKTVPRTWFLLPYALLFLPLAVMLGSAWVAAQRVEARLDPTAPSPGGAIRRGIRRNLIVLLPLLLLLGLQDSLGALAALGVPGFRTLVAWHDAFPDLQALLLLVVIGVLAYLSPAIFRRAMKADPIPLGDLRTTLERLSAAIGLRCRDFLLWKTGGRVANAMVVGMTGRTRYVFLTDALLAGHPLPEVAAVVAHEAGHAKKHHLPLYFAVSLSLLLLMRTAEEVATPLLGGASTAVLTLLFLAVFWFGFLGWLSRKFERQADAFGADHAAALAPDAPPLEVPGLPAPLPLGTALMIQALKRLERRQVGGVNLRHGPVSQRVAFLAAYAVEPRVREEHRGDGRRLLIGIGLFVAAALASTLARLPGGLVRGEANLLLQQAEDRNREGIEKAEAGDAAGARAAFESVRANLVEAIGRSEQRPDDPYLRLVAANSWLETAEIDLRRLGRPTEADAGYRKTLEILQGMPSWRAAADRQAAQIQFHANLGLGRLALRAPGDAGAAVKVARTRLANARAVSEDLFGGPYRNASLRLLESAIVLRDPEATPEQKAEARRVLEGQSRSAEKGDDWADLRADAADELRVAAQP
jgi:STE24 endopeptidase